MAELDCSGLLLYAMPNVWPLYVSFSILLLAAWQLAVLEKSTNTNLMIRRKRKRNMQCFTVMVNNLCNYHDYVVMVEKMSKCFSAMTMKATNGHLMNIICGGESNLRYNEILKVVSELFMHIWDRDTIHCFRQNNCMP